MPKLPRASGDLHVAAFKRAGWMVNHIEGSHYILLKEGNPVHPRYLFTPGKNWDQDYSVSSSGPPD